MEAAAAGQTLQDDADLEGHTCISKVVVWVSKVWLAAGDDGGPAAPR